MRCALRFLRLAPPLACLLAWPLWLHGGAMPAEPPPTTAPAAASIELLRSSVHYLAGDELEGRGIGTRGLDLAADYLAERFEKMKLTPPQGGYFQNFQTSRVSGIGDRTALKLNGRPLKRGEQYTPVTLSAEKAFEGDVVFAGYGVSAPEHQYDDYAGLDVKGKVVLVLRYEPHKGNRSRFSRDDWSDHAGLYTKARVAAERGAVALLLVNPPEHHGQDMLMPVSPRMGATAKIPFVQIKRTVAEEMLKAAGQPDLSALQKGIDADAKPASAALKGVKVDGVVELKRTTADLKNVVAILPGRGDRAGEYIVVGAHYDHLGRGGLGSLSGTKEIHNGADDNASGTAALVELARVLSARGPLERSVLFVAFSGEEAGLLGSAHFVANPPVPLEKIVAMLNMDMVGRLRDDTLYIGGGGTAAEFEPMLQQLDDASPLQFRSIGRGGFGPSDHMSFAMKKIPVLFFFTGMHPDYHRPSDDADKINFQGVAQIVDLAADVVRQWAAMPRPAYVNVGGTMRVGMGQPARGGAALGIVPDYGQEEAQGVRVSDVVGGSAAEQAGLRGGDILTHFGDQPLANLMDLTEALGAARPGQKVKLLVKRGDKTIELEATLGKRPGQ